MRTTMLLSTLSAALALSTMTAGAFATTAPAPAATPPAALPIPPPPPRVAQDANGNPMPPATPAPTGSTQVASVPTASPFLAIDRNRTGVVTKEQANGDPWLSTNFARCDADHNDEVNLSEYETCSTQMK